jgi:hypothetical protein
MNATFAIAGMLLVFLRAALLADQARDVEGGRMWRVSRRSMRLTAWLTTSTVAR